MAFVDTQLNINNLKLDQDGKPIEVDGKPILIKVQEDNLPAHLATLLQQNGWEVVAQFKKVVFEHEWVNPKRAPVPESVGDVVVAHHFIYKSKTGKYFGLAVAAQWQQRYGEILEQNRPRNSLVKFGFWANSLFDKYRARHTLYFYMLEDLGDITSAVDENHNIVIAWKQDATMLRGALDIEITGTSYNMVGSAEVYKIAQYDEKRMQSPIIAAGLRVDDLEQYYDKVKDANVFYTNWWDNSEVTVRGWIDPETVFLIIQADTVPAFENNQVPSIPFYFGKLDALDPYDDAVCMFAGSVDTTTANGTINVDDSKLKFEAIMPYLKNYRMFPANGIENVMVSRSKQGARYQAYSLSWNAPPNMMKPERIGKNGRKYPRSWNMNFQTDVYKYQFNPSRYSEKVHTSKIYVVHPEEGVRGSLSRVLALPAINFSAQKLKVKTEQCPDTKYDVYRYFLIDGVSPLTKRPGTHFRPAGVGIYFAEETE